MTKQPISLSDVLMKADPIRDVKVDESSPMQNVYVLNQHKISELVSFYCANYNELRLEDKMVVQNLVGAKMKDPELFTDENVQWTVEKNWGPDWFKILALKEAQIRAERRHNKTAVVRADKQRQDDLQAPVQCLLKYSKSNSIFKIKWQYKEPVKTKIGYARFIQTVWSRDYPDERKWFEEPLKAHIESLVEERADTAYELFDKGSKALKKGGFNGFTYSAKTLNKMSNDISFFGIYLNNVYEQQANNENWCREIFTWGRMKKVNVEEDEL